MFALQDKETNPSIKESENGTQTKAYEHTSVSIVLNKLTIEHYPSINKGSLEGDLPLWIHPRKT